MSRFANRLHQGVVKGASLYITPATSTVANGGTLVLTIRENSGGEAVNAVQANLTYPTNRLTFQSIDTSASNFTTTIESSGGSGIVHIGVGLLGGSLTGDQLVATVTFTANAVGSAAVPFDTGSGIARTSDATDICKQKTGGNYTIS